MYQFIYSILESIHVIIYLCEYNRLLLFCFVAVPICTRLIADWVASACRQAHAHTHALKFVPKTNSSIWTLESFLAFKCVFNKKQRTVHTVVGITFDGKQASNTYTFPSNLIHSSEINRIFNFIVILKEYIVQYTDTQTHI